MKGSSHSVVKPWMKMWFHVQWNKISVCCNSPARLLQHLCYFTAHETTPIVDVEPADITIHIKRQRSGILINGFNWTYLPVFTRIHGNDNSVSIESSIAIFESTDVDIRLVVLTYKRFNVNLDHQCNPIWEWPTTGGVAQWQERRSWPANFPCRTLDIQHMGDHLCGQTVRWKSANQVNSTFHPLRVDKWLVSCN